MQSTGKRLLLAPIMAAILLVGLLGGGCATPPPAAPPPAAPTPGAPAPGAAAPATVVPATSAAVAVPTGDLKIAVGSLGQESMDPTREAANTIIGALSPMYDFLVGADVNGNLSKDYGLARDWKVEQTGTSSVYTFYLRQGVKFHDGTEFTAQDVKFALEYTMRTGSMASGAAAFRGLIDRVEAPSQYEAVVYTKKPYAFLLYDLSPLGIAQGLMLPKSYIEKNGSDYFNQHPIGTGPYKFKEHKQGVSVTYEAIDYKHWLFGVPKYKTVTFMLVPEESTRIAMLKTGEADVIDPVSTTNIPSVEAAGSKTFSNKGSLILYAWLSETFQQGTYLNDVNVRQALNLAVDRQAILDQIFNKAGSVSGNGIYGSRAYGYQPAPLYDYDPAKAKAVLEKAIKDNGWSKVELTFNSFPWPGVPQSSLVTEAIAGMWQKAFGNLISVQIVPTEWPVYRQKLVDKKAANIVAVAATDNVPFWNVPWQNTWHSKGSFYNATTPQLDALIDKLGAETDLGKIAQDQIEINKYMRDNQFLLPLLELNAVTAANPKKVTQWDLGRFRYDPNYRDLFVQGRAFPAQ